MILALTILYALLLVQWKHLLIDWIWQPAYEHQNKGRYGHFGGIRHAAKNAIGTGLTLWIGFLPVITLSIDFVLVLIGIDFFIHYHIDFAKVNLNRTWGLGPLTHPQFWWLTGVDQFLHQATYLGLIVLIILCVPGLG